MAQPSSQGSRWPGHPLNMLPCLFCYGGSRDYFCLCGVPVVTASRAMRPAPAAANKVADGLVPAFSRVVWRCRCAAGRDLTDPGHQFVRAAPSVVAEGARHLSRSSRESRWPGHPLNTMYCLFRRGGGRGWFVSAGSHDLCHGITRYKASACRCVRLLTSLLTASQS